VKNQTQSYISKEEAVEARPVELYHFWKADGSQHWRYTSHDADVEYQGKTYQAAAINRGPVQYDSDVEVSTLQVFGVFQDDPVVEYLAQNPVEIVWAEVIRVHKDLPDQGSNVFIGQISGVAFQGQEAIVNCVGFEFHLRQPALSLRYQPRCNHFVYDEIIDGVGCGVDKSAHKLTKLVTVNGLSLTNADLASYSDGYFKYGWVEWQGHRRMIVSHEGQEIKIRYRIPGLMSGATVDIYPGCDGRAETCRDKFSNINQFLGFTQIPVDNPATKY